VDDETDDMRQRYAIGTIVAHEVVSACSSVSWGRLGGQATAAKLSVLQWLGESAGQGWFRVVALLAMLPTLMGPVSWVLPFTHTRLFCWLLVLVPVCCLCYIFLPSLFLVMARFPCRSPHSAFHAHCGLHPVPCCCCADPVVVTHPHPVSPPRHQAHQWFGDLVTCEDWTQLWLNEGFASYFETVGE
jgi:hypothetical protein